MQDSWQQLRSDSTSWHKTLKNSHNSQIQWLVVSKTHLNQKVGFEGILRLHPYWTSQPATYKVNMEWKSELSVWTKTILTHRSEFLMAWINWSRTWATRRTMTTSRKPQKCSSKNMRWIWMRVILHADQSLQQNHKDVLLPAQKTVPIGERTWNDIEPQDHSPIDYPVSKQLINLLRHGNLAREDDGAIEFWRLQDYLRNDFIQSQHWSDEKWKNTTVKGGGNKKNFNIVLILQEKFFTSELFKVIQDAIPLILHCRTMCWFRTISSSTFITSDVRSIYTPSWIRDWYQEDKFWAKDRQYLFFTSVDPMNKEHRDPETVDLKARRLARYLQTAWKKHQNTVYWVDIRLAQKKGLKFYQTRSNAIILHETIPAYCDGNWRSDLRESFCVTSTSSEDFLWRQLDEKIGFRSCWTWWKLPTNTTKDHNSNC